MYTKNSIQCCNRRNSGVRPRADKMAQSLLFFCGIRWGPEDISSDFRALHVGNTTEPNPSLGCSPLSNSQNGKNSVVFAM